MRLIFLIAALTAGAQAHALELSTQTIHWSGHLIAGYDGYESTGTGGFGVNEAYLESLYEFDSKLNARAGFFLNKFGEPKAALRTAYLEFKIHQTCRLQAGRVILPTSRDHAAKLADLEFSNRSRTVSELYKNEATGTDQGIKAVGRAAFFDYAAALVNGTGSDSADDNRHRTSILRLAANWPEFALAGYGYWGKQGPGGAEMPKNRWGGEMRLGPPEFPIRVEYHLGEDGAMRRAGWIIQAETILPLFSQEAYEKLAWLRTIRPALRFERWDPDLDQINDKEMIASYAINWYPYQHLRLSLQYDDRQEEDRAYQVSNNSFSARVQASF